MKVICAYYKGYLDKARTALGRMLDFAVYDLKYNLTDFFPFRSCFSPHSFGMILFYHI